MINSNLGRFSKPCGHLHITCGFASNENEVRMYSGRQSQTSKWCLYILPNSGVIGNGIEQETVMVNSNIHSERWCQQRITDPDNTN